MRYDNELLQEKFSTVRNLAIRLQSEAFEMRQQAKALQRKADDRLAEAEILFNTYDKFASVVERERQEAEREAVRS